MSGSDPMTLIVVWGAVPLVVVAVSALVGFLVFRLAGLALSPVAWPVGYLVSVVVVAAAIQAGAPGRFAAWLPLVAAAAGLVLAVVELRRGRLVRPDRALVSGAGAGLVYVVAMLPLLVSRALGVIGYNIFNDHQVHIVRSQVAWDFGAAIPPGPESTVTLYASQFDAGYPVGLHAWPMVAKLVTGAQFFDLYSPLEALSLSFLAMTGFAVLVGLGLRARWAAAGSVAVGLGYLPYSFFLEGSAKEVALAVAVYTIVALAMGPWRSHPYRTLLPLAFAALGAVAFLGPAALVWIGPGLVVVAVRAAIDLRGRGRHLVGRWAWPGVALAVVVVAALAAGVARLVLRSASGLIGDQLALPGNVSGSLPLPEVFGFWLSEDFRSWPQTLWPSLLLVALAAVLLVIGGARLWRERRAALPAAVGLGVVGALVVLALGGSWYWMAKFFVVIAPGITMAMVLGVADMAARSGWIRWAGAAGATVMTVGVGLSVFHAYGGSQVSPNERYTELEDVRVAATGHRGPILIVPRIIYGTSFFGNWDPVFFGDDPTTVKNLGLARKGVDYGPPRIPDVSHLRDRKLNQFGLILEETGPLNGTPPSNFELLYDGRFFRLWERRGEPPAVNRQASSRDTGLGKLECDEPGIAGLLRTAQREDKPVRIRRPTGAVVVVPARAFRRSGEWETHDAPDGSVSQIIERNPDATAQANFNIPRDGTYEVWLRGNFPRGFDVAINGREVGRTPFAPNVNVDSHVKVGEMELVAGQHELDLGDAGPSNFTPGSRRKNELVWVILKEKRSPEFVTGTVSATEARRLCGAFVDWIEVGDDRGQASPRR